MEKMSFESGVGKGNPNLTNPNTRYRCKYCTLNSTTAGLSVSTAGQ